MLSEKGLLLRCCSSAAFCFAGVWWHRGRGPVIVCSARITRCKTHYIHNARSATHIDNTTLRKVHTTHNSLQNKAVGRLFARTFHNNNLFLSINLNIIDLQVEHPHIVLLHRQTLNEIQKSLRSVSKSFPNIRKCNCESLFGLSPFQLFDFLISVCASVCVCVAILNTSAQMRPHAHAHTHTGAQHSQIGVTMQSKNTNTPKREKMGRTKRIMIHYEFFTVTGSQGNSQNRTNVNEKSS